MNKIIKTLVLLIGLSSSLAAQTLEVNACAGENQQAGNTKLSWTIGEPIVAPLSAGNANINSGFHQSLCPSNGRIEGCNFACAGESSQTYTYEAFFSGRVEDYSWEILQTDDAEFVTPTSVNDKTVQIKFTNPYPANNYVDIRVIPTNSCDGEYTEYRIDLDTDCVWPGSVHRYGNDVVDWDDEFALYKAYDVMLLQPQNTNAAPIRDLPCYDNSPSVKFSFQPQPSEQSSFSYEVSGSTYNMKHADCNGDGMITLGNSGNSSNSTPFNDDIAALNENMLEPVSSSQNPFISPYPPPNHQLKLTALDETMPENYEPRLLVELGESTYPVEDVYAVAFTVEFSYGTYNNPKMQVSGSHMLSAPTALKYGSYLVGGTESTARLNFFIARSQHPNPNYPNSGVDFLGEEVCTILCVATIGDILGNTPQNMKTLQPDSIVVTLINGGFLKFDGTMEPIITGDTTIIRLAPRALSIAPKTILSGAYDSNENLMRDDLRTLGLVPLTEPYSALNFPRPADSGGETIDSSLLSITGQDAIVDWVWVELRDSEDSTNILAARAALVQRDGDVVDTDGVSAVEFQRWLDGDYYVAIRHRNHLGMMTAAPLVLSDSTTVVDFTDSNLALYDDASCVVTNNYRLLRNGDGNQDGIVDSNDRSTSWNNRNKGGYRSDDHDLNGIVDSADRSTTWNNRNSEDGIP